MSRCRYAAEVWIAGYRVLARCKRRAVLGSSGWHLHAADVPDLEPVGVRLGTDALIRWRSTSTRDFDATRDPLAHAQWPTPIRPVRDEPTTREGTRR